MGDSALHRLHEKLRPLAAYDEWPALTLQMPGSADGDREHRRVQIKSLAQAAISIDQIDEGLEAMAQRIDGLTKADPTSGHVIYLGNDVDEAFVVPDIDQAKMKHGHVFDLTAILDVLDLQRFFLLIASQGRVILLSVEGTSAKEISGDRLPTSFSAVARHTSEKQEGYHAQAAAAAAVEIHAAGLAPREEADKQLDKFVDAVARELDDALANETQPLVLAADDDLLGRLRKAVRYRYLAQEGIHRHPESLSRQALLARAAAIVRRERGASDEKSSGNGRLEKASRDLVSEDLAEIVPAARQGRVAYLALHRSERVLASDSETGGALLFASANTDLVNDALRQTLLHGGDVALEAQGNGNGDAAASALFRN